MDYAAVYSRVHQDRPKHWSGTTIRRHVADIAALIDRVRAQRLLDYGCGKGAQYLTHRVHERWGGVLPHCYDIGVRYLAARPQGVFDGVICTDVLEHVEESDVDAVLNDLFSFAGSIGFVFLAISCIPCKEITLPDGRNAHLTQRPPEWWAARLVRFERPGLIIETRYETERA